MSLDGLCVLLLIKIGFRSLPVSVLSEAKHILDPSLHWIHQDENRINLLVTPATTTKRPKKKSPKQFLSQTPMSFLLFPQQHIPLFLAAAALATKNTLISEVCL